MPTIKIKLFKLIGILLIVLGLFLLIGMYFFNDAYQCVADPVAYANNNSDNYWWDNVQAIKYYLPIN